MTAVLHAIELFIPGTPASHLHATELHIPIRPVAVTAEVRRRLVKKISADQRLWSLLIVSAGLIFGLMMSYSATQRGLSEDIRREALRPILIAVVLLVGYLHFDFGKQRRFAMSAPAAVAQVVEEPSASEGMLPRLALRYTPLPLDPNEHYTMLDGPCAPPEWADMEGAVTEVEGKIRGGDLVSILYDPKDLTHVRLVEN